jgi:hypothetical protein
LFDVFLSTFSPTHSFFLWPFSNAFLSISIHHPTNLCNFLFFWVGGVERCIDAYTEIRQYIFLVSERVLHNIQKARVPSFSLNFFFFWYFQIRRPEFWEIERAER